MVWKMDAAFYVNQSESNIFQNHIIMTRTIFQQFQPKNQIFNRTFSCFIVMGSSAALGTMSKNNLVIVTR